MIDRTINGVDAKICHGEEYSISEQLNVTLVDSLPTVPRHC